MTIPTRYQKTPWWDSKHFWRTTSFISLLCLVIGRQTQLNQLHHCEINLLTTAAAVRGGGDDGRSGGGFERSSSFERADTTSHVRTAKKDEKMDLEAIAQRVITNRPAIPTGYGTLKGASEMAPFVDLRPFNKKTDKETRGWDDEAHHAVTNYFWGKTQGIVVELGGLDGQRYSVSKDFLPLQWHRILMEASPNYAQMGPTRSPEATFVFSAICNKLEDDKPQFVHYLRDTKGNGAINGIGEFMSKSFMKRFHRSVYKATDEGQDFGKVTDWKEWSANHYRERVDEIPCTDLETIFRSIGVRHVNFFMLDVEGGEMDVLKSVDWDNILFDVLAVETDQENRPPNYTEDVTEYLQQRGYVVDGTIGRNTWFYHKTFQPSKKDSMTV